ncbi:unnamed protein product [Rotaria magnacalcarata]
MKSRHDKQDLLERLLKDNGGTGLASHIEHKKKIQASFIKLQWGYQVPIYMTTIPEDKLRKQQDLNNHIPLLIARLQQLENQLKQQQ